MGTIRSKFDVRSRAYFLYKRINTGQYFIETEIPPMTSGGHDAARNTRALAPTPPPPPPGPPWWPVVEGLGHSEHARSSSGPL